MGVTDEKVASLVKSRKTSSFIVALVIVVTALPSLAQRPTIERTYKNGKTAVKMEPIKISGEKDEYYSLHFGLSYKYEGTEHQLPEYIDVEIQTVVKLRKLNPDLYVQFLIDNERVFLSSNRWAVKNPVPGKRMIGERIAMRMPLGTYLKLAKAETSTLQMGRTLFEISAEQKAAMLELLQPPSS